MAKPHPKPLSDQRQLQFDLESMAMWIRGIDRPLRVRQLIEALVRFGYCYQGDAERVATDAPAERFLGVWLIKASKSDLAGVVGLSTPTLKRCIQFLRRNGSDLIAVEFGDNEAHDFAINLSEIRGADPRPPRPIPRLDPVGRSPTDPGIRGGIRGGSGATNTNRRNISSTTTDDPKPKVKRSACGPPRADDHGRAFHETAPGGRARRGGARPVVCRRKRRRRSARVFVLDVATTDRQAV